MPTRVSPKPKETRLSIRATEPEKTILMQAAKARHTNISQFVLQASLDAAHAVLVDQSEFRLTPEEWKAFCDRLDAPAKEIPALQELFRKIAHEAIPPAAESGPIS